MNTKEREEGGERDREEERQKKERTSEQARDGQKTTGRTVSDGQADRQRGTVRHTKRTALHGGPDRTPSTSHTNFSRLVSRLPPAVRVSCSKRMLRGPESELHKAASGGSIKRAVALLSRESIDLDTGDPEGFTPLMLATDKGHAQIVRILLNRGAGLAAVNDNGAAALHIASQNGHPAVAKMLVEGGADVEAVMSTALGSRPLHLTADEGHSEVMRVLIEAGADPDTRRSDGATPLFAAMYQGHIGATRELLRAGASPLLTMTDELGNTGVPLDAAVTNGHSDVVREVIDRLGIEGCGGASAGVDALRQAAGYQHLGILSMLTDAGVLDTGEAVIQAAVYGREASLRFLLRRHWRQTPGERAYINGICDSSGKTLLFCNIANWRHNATRIVRLLVDAGADVTSAVRLTGAGNGVVFDDTPLAFAEFFLRVKKRAGEDATEEQLQQLEAVRRLLLQVEAIHAISWLWPSASCFVSADEDSRKRTEGSTPLRETLPILRRRAGRSGVLWAALFRWVTV